MRSLLLLVGLTAVGASGLVAQGWQTLLDRQGLRQPMAYDAVRDRVVMFTAWTEPRIYEWDGTSWLATFLPNGPISSTRVPRMAYDSARRETVLLFDGNTRGYDGASWRLLDSNGPGRTDIQPNVSAYDEQRQVLVYYEFATRITHEWNGVQWQAVAAPLFTGGVPFVGYDPVRQKVLAFAQGVFGGVFAYDGTAWTQLPGATFPAGFPVRDMAICSDPVRNRLLVHGGVDGAANALGNLWEWNGSAWANVAAGPLRRDAAMAPHPGSGRLILTGGYDGTEVHADTWGYDTAFQRLEESPLLGLTATDTLRQRIVGVGREPHPGGPEYTWEWDGVRWQRMAGPHAILASLVFDASRGVMVGIENDFNRPILRTWIWSGGTWQLQSPPIDPPWQPNQSLCHDPVRQVLVMFGLHGTWEWDGTAWNLRTPAHAPTRASSSAAQASVFDPNTGVVRLVIATPTGIQEWEWDGTDWRQATTAGLPQASPIRMLIDPPTGRVLLLGITGSSGGSTWERAGGTWRVIASLPPATGTATLDPFTGILRAWAPGTWSALHADPAANAPYGTGCGVGGGGPWLAGLGTASPIGDNLRLDLGRGPAGAPCALYAGLLPGSLPLGGGCTLLLDQGLHAGNAVTSAVGFASFPVSVPDQPSLVGLDVFWQAVAFQAGGPLLGAAVLTNGVRVHLGH